MAAQCSLALSSRSISSRGSHLPRAAPPPSPGGSLRKRAADRRSFGKSWLCALCKAFPRYINDGNRKAPRSGTCSPSQHHGAQPPSGLGAVVRL